MEFLVPSSRDVATHLDAGYSLALTDQRLDHRVSTPEVLVRDPRRLRGDEWRASRVRSQLLLAYRRVGAAAASVGTHLRLD
jgi:hypothetical protein